ncbi:MAG: hypothetical protein WCA46_02785 [Actinocatenispora sp.]
MTRHSPPRRLLRLTALGCAAAVVGSLAATTTAPASAGPPAARAASTSHRPSRVTLPTGERLALRWYGATPRVSQLPGDHQPISIVRAGTHVYAFPVEAVPYLDAALDRSLFDVTALAAEQGPDGAGRIPVALTFAGTGTAAKAGVLGVRITSTSATHATGYLDGRSAATFGAALRSRVRHDPAGARRAGTPVAGLTRLALDAPRPRAVRPHFPMVTLTVNLTPPAGKTVLGADVWISNSDDSRRYQELVSVGEENYAKVSLPKGNYFLVGTVIVAADDGSFGAFYVPITVDYAVTADDQEVTLDANKATASASFSTPHPAELTDVYADVVAGDTLDSRNGRLFGYLAENQLLVQPTPKPRYGVLAFGTWERRSAAPTGETPFDYHLAEDWPSGIPADLHRTLTTEDLTRVEDHFVAPKGIDTVWLGRGPVFPGDRGGALGNDTLTDPTRHVDYLYGPPGVAWETSAGRSVTLDDDGFGTEHQWTGPVTFPAGRTSRVDWFRESLAPGFQSKETFPEPYCVACRTAGRMDLSIDSEMDGDPTHWGSIGGSVTGFSRFQVFQDDTRIVDEPDTEGVSFPVPAEEHTYRIEDTVDRSKLGFTTASRTSSVYTVRSSATSGEPVPDGWRCDASTGTEGCTVLPLLTMTVPLPTAQDGTMPVGTSQFVVSVGHVPAAARSAISTLTFDTSVDGGAYRPATVTDLGDGRYQVTLRTSAEDAGRPVSIRVHAEDAAGSTLTQTVTDAYTIAGS